jgi:hypothetical protein
VLGWSWCAISLATEDYQSSSNEQRMRLLSRQLVVLRHRWLTVVKSTSHKFALFVRLGGEGKAQTYDKCCYHSLTQIHSRKGNTLRRQSAVSASSDKANWCSLAEILGKEKQ